MNIAISRLNKEIKKCIDFENFQIDLHDDNILEWRIKFNPQTKVFKKCYDIKIIFPQNYPFSSPKIIFLSNIFHPNIDIKGNVCLGILSDWKSKYTATTMLNYIQSMFEEPNLDNPLNIEAANLWPKQDQYIKKIINY